MNEHVELGHAAGGRPSGAVVTLVGTTVLHAFTHIYLTMFLPLYVLMRDDLHLTGVNQAGLVATVYGLVYWALAFQAGKWSDRYDRRLLLGVGLLGNALAVIGIGLARQYEVIVLLAAVGGMFGSLFHPCANALVPAHFPKSPGTAIGLLGIGSGLGFFFGPFYAGWSAERGLWGSSPNWQRPMLELGAAGIVVAILYLLVAREAGSHSSTPKPLLPKGMRRRVMAHAFFIAMREFAGVGTMTLSALYLLKALKYDTAKTGSILGASMLVAAVVNPLTVYLTGGRRRMKANLIVIGTAGVMILSVPHWSEGWVLPVLIVAQTLALVSSAITDAALTERIAPHFRGRVNGIFLTIVGTTAGLSPFVVAFAVDLLGVRSLDKAGFYWPYLGLGLLMFVAAGSYFTFRAIERFSAPAEAVPAAASAATA